MLDLEAGTDLVRGLGGVQEWWVVFAWGFPDERSRYSCARAENGIDSLEMHRYTHGTAERKENN